MRPENKVDLGVIQVHTNVIADICSLAIAEIEGVTLFRNDPLEGLASLVGVRLNTAVEVRVEASGQVSVVVKVILRYGLNLPETSRRIQDAVMTAVEKMADINLRDVDVSIQGINKGVASCVS
ncbi:MAG: Asp23/Gls24 family envelope stress response protein [Candidatus Omnitrophica bacterium]|nr:Asp23/Gls24 family envelope stress response protein [Candidatus Omnitrophota bacterium]